MGHRRTGLSSSASSPRAVLTAVRSPLLDLHRVLLDIERRQHEVTHGRVSAATLLGLALHHPAFMWLHQLSEVIARVDETLAQEEGPTWTDVETFARQVRALLRPDAEGTDFERRYDQAVQQSPEALLAHRAVIQALPSSPTAAPLTIH